MQDEGAWETLPEAWEDGPERNESCAACGRVAHHSEMTEALRRCGTGYGEWYCNAGTGCQGVVCVECGIETGRALVIWEKMKDDNQRRPRCRTGFGCRRKNAR